MTIETIRAPKIINVRSSLPQMGGFVLNFQPGPLLEYPGVRGLSHLVEHLLAKPYAKDKAQQLSQLGLTANANTSPTGVNFFVYGLTKYVERFLEDDFMGEVNTLNHVPTREEFETERNIVIQECENYLSDAAFALSQNILRKYTNFYAAIGYIDDLKALMYEGCLDWIERFRQPSHFLYCGDATDKPWLTGEYWDRGRDAMCITSGENQQAVLPAGVPGYKIEYFGRSDRQSIVMDWFELPETVTPWEQRVLENLWNSGLEMSPLMREIRVKHGLCYYAGIDGLWTPTRIFSNYITTAPENVQKVRDLSDDVLHNWDRYLTRDWYDMVMQRQRIEVEKRDLLNFNFTNMLNTIRGEDERVTNERLDMFSFERMQEIHAMFTDVEFHRACVGTEIVLD